MRSTCRLWKSRAGQMRARLCLRVRDATQTDHHRLLTLLCHSLLVCLAILPVHRLAASASENVTSTAGLRAPRPRRWAPNRSCCRDRLRVGRRRLRQRDCPSQFSSKLKGRWSCGSPARRETCEEAKAGSQVACSVAAALPSPCAQLAPQDLRN
jgi:hypothetical protein